MNNIQWEVFQQNNAPPHTAVVTQHALQPVDMFPWPTRSPELYPIKNLLVIIGRHLQHHPQLAAPVLTQQV
ncbi:uncharacterized protein TNCV_447051 [Trichonephila clavipes]|nr:uncharacterized protein TNCV_447051 [Trichonephila clavipes]